MMHKDRFLALLMWVQIPSTKGLILALKLLLKGVFFPLLLLLLWETNWAKNFLEGKGFLMAKNVIAKKIKQIIKMKLS